jgi:TonB family protein
LTAAAATPQPHRRVLRLTFRTREDAAPGRLALAVSFLGHLAFLLLCAALVEPVLPRRPLVVAPVRLVSAPPGPRHPAPEPRRQPAQVTPAAPPVQPPARAAAGIERPRPSPPKPKPRPPPKRSAAAPPAPERRETPPVDRAEPVQEPEAAPAGAEASVGGLVGRVDDAGFTDGGYLERLVRQVGSRWIKPRSGLPRRDAVVTFDLARSGEVTGVRLEESSGVDHFDRSGLRAVELAVPLPPLPPSYRGASLLVHFHFMP